MQCALYERECIECGECDMCDLDPSKRCDNCCVCIESQTDFAEMRVDAMVDMETYLQEELNEKSSLLEADDDADYDETYCPGDMENDDDGNDGDDEDAN